MEETSEELPEKVAQNSQVARFANLSEHQLQQILAERHSQGTLSMNKLLILSIISFDVIWP